MAIRSRRNQYLGINAHANDLMQVASAEWMSFHHDHITDITRALNKVLPPGYEARSERSLQIREVQPESKTTRKHAPQPDITAYEVESSPEPATMGPQSAATLVAKIVDTMDISEDDLGAVVIYQVEQDDQFGRPVTRIELLSPTNKPPADGYRQYRDKRNIALRSGMPLVEIDLLHWQPAIVKNLKSYPDEPDSHPYCIIVSDPRPSIQAGKAFFYLFDVDAPMPRFDIPLDQGQKVAAFDLNSVYNLTFENSPALQRLVNYEERPAAFHTYSAADQARILARMETVVAMYRQGKNLDLEGPFLVGELRG